MVKSLIPIQRPRVRFPVAVNFLPASDKIVNLYLDVSDSFHSLLVIGCLAERLRRWTRNPLGNSCVGSNPAAVVNFSTFLPPQLLFSRNMAFVTSPVPAVIFVCSYSVNKSQLVREQFTAENLSLSLCSKVEINSRL